MTTEQFIQFSLERWEIATQANLESRFWWGNLLNSLRIEHGDTFMKINNEFWSTR